MSGIGTTLNSQGPLSIQNEGAPFKSPRVSFQPCKDRVISLRTERKGEKKKISSRIKGKTTTASANPRRTKESIDLCTGSLTFETLCLDLDSAEHQFSAFNSFVLSSANVFNKHKFSLNDDVYSSLEFVDTVHKRIKE